MSLVIGLAVLIAAYVGFVTLWHAVIRRGERQASEEVSKSENQDWEFPPRWRPPGSQEGGP